MEMAGGVEKDRISDGISVQVVTRNIITSWSTGVESESSLGGDQLTHAHRRREQRAVLNRREDGRQDGECRDKFSL